MLERVPADIYARQPMVATNGLLQQLDERVVRSFYVRQEKLERLL